VEGGRGGGVWRQHSLVICFRILDATCVVEYTHQATGIPPVVAVRCVPTSTPEKAAQCIPCLMVCEVPRGVIYPHTIMPHHVVQPPPSTHTTPQDSFYRPLTPEEAANVADFNFDHPDAFDTPLLLECMSKLKAGCAVEVPVYDFATHSRSSTTRRVRPAGGGGGVEGGLFGEGCMGRVVVVVVVVVVGGEPPVRVPCWLVRVVGGGGRRYLLCGRCGVLAARPVCLCPCETSSKSECCRSLTFVVPTHASHHSLSSLSALLHTPTHLHTHPHTHTHSHTRCPPRT
jgi:hypothetical protein